MKRIELWRKRARDSVMGGEGQAPAPAAADDAVLRLEAEHAERTARAAAGSDLEDTVPAAFYRSAD